MPRRINRRGRARRPRKIFRKKFNKKVPRNTVIVRQPGMAIPPRMITTFKYGEVISITPAVADTVKDYVFNLNGIYDPNQTGGGGQPLFRDQLLGNIYNRYRVYKTSWEVHFYPLNGSVYSKVWVLPTNYISSLDGTSESLMLEKPRSISKWLSVDSPTKFKGHAYLPAINGSTKVAYMSDDRFQAQYNANPVEVMGLHLCVSNSASFAVRAEVIIKYHCELFDPLQVSES